MVSKTVIIDEVGDLAAKPGSRSWAVAVKGEILSALHDVESSADHLSRMIKMMEERAGYQALGFASFDEFCAAPPPNGLGKTKIAINIEVNQRKIAQTQMLAENAKPLAETPGGDRKSERYQNHFDNYQNDFDNKGGTSNDYLTARIARDNPAILEDMKQGKYRSVRAAAIDAGIIDPNKARRFQLPTDPAAAGRYLAGRVDHEWLMECVDAFMKATSQ